MEQEHLTEIVTRIIFQFAIILLAAKIAGEVCLRYLRVPPVLGELAAGVAIGPFALGALQVGGLGPLFAIPPGALENPFQAIPREIYLIGQVASVVLLFAAGLETDLKRFLRFAGPASLVALGGVVLPFGFGVMATVFMGFADSFGDPVALFMGAIMTATSVGITARVLADLGRLNSAEGTTIIAAAVLDDVVGLLVLSMVVALATTGGVSAGALGLVAARAIGFWLGLTAVTLLASGWIFRVFTGFRAPGATLALSLALALTAAALAEKAGLAMIIGAYSVGLALSSTPLRHRIEESLMGLYHAIVPVFFVVMGMLVDLGAMQGALLFGLVLTLLAIVGKVVGSGGLALLGGFNRYGAWRIGLGMLPRGEVALIIAGIGLTRDIISVQEFGVAIMMTVVTTVMAPVLLVPAFRSERSGMRRDQGSSAGEQPARSGDRRDGE
jgi:Kef-type K+ transport system membrane component KefB